MPGPGFKEHPENINKNGRPPKGETLTDLLRERLDKKAFIDKLIELYQKDDLAAIKYIYDRYDGLMSQKTVITGDENEPVTINFRPIKDGN